VNWLEYLRSAFLGSATARREHALALAGNPGIISGLSTLRTLSPPDAADRDAPIFLLSAGWRSGSTLLQRLIMSDHSTLLWGEPYDECGIIQAMAATVKAFRTTWPPSDYYYDAATPRQLTGDWIANLFPAPASLRQAHRAFFDKAFAEPARSANVVRWGIKEVRLSVEHAHYLHWLYPSARFVFLYRNPLEAYQSYCRYGRNWYDTWPDKPVLTPTAFGRHWRELTTGFLSGASALDALVVRYDELIDANPALLQRIEHHLDVRLDPSVLRHKIGSSERDGGKAWVSRLEKSLLRRAVSPVAEELGYLW
jgi:hypothetical protein